jgi:hypothetical protein
MPPRHRTKAVPKPNTRVENQHEVQMSTSTSRNQYAGDEARKSGRLTRRVTSLRSASSTGEENLMSGALPLPPTKIHQTTQKDKNDRSQQHQEANTKSSRSRKPLVPAPPSESTIQPARRATTPRQRNSITSVQSSVETPQPESPTGSELYGLSPGGEATQSKLESQAAISRRTSAHQPASVLQAFGTPLVASSISGLRAFKRRKRQPSIIRLMQDTSDIGTNLGGDSSDLLDDSNLGLDDFNPENESTPLQLNSRTRQEGEEEQDKSEISLPSSRKRKLQEPEVQVARSPEPPSSPPSSPPLSDGSDLPVDDVDVIPATAPDDEIVSETQAPPMSSSSFLSSPPPSTRTNHYSTQTRGRRKRTDQGQISTLELQSLLPRTRRSKRLQRPEEDVDLTNSSDLLDSEPPSLDTVRPSSETILSDSEEVEAEASPPRPARKSRRTASMIKTAKPAPSRRRPLQLVQVQRSSRLNQAPRNQPNDVAQTTKEMMRKYGQRARESEAEEGEEEGQEGSIFQDMTDETIVAQNVQIATVMERMKAKFAEVDQWEMEFETVDYSSASSNWR